MDTIEKLTHVRIKRMAVFINTAVALFYRMVAIGVVRFIGIQIPDSGYKLIGKKVFDEKKLAKISDIAGVAVLHTVTFPNVGVVHAQLNCHFPIKSLIWVIMSSIFAFLSSLSPFVLITILSFDTSTLFFCFTGLDKAFLIVSNASERDSVFISL